MSAHLGFSFGKCCGDFFFLGVEGKDRGGVTSKVIKCREHVQKHILVLSWCTRSQEPLQKTKQYTTANQ